MSLVKNLINVVLIDSKNSFKNLGMFYSTKRKIDEQLKQRLGLRRPTEDKYNL